MSDRITLKSYFNTGDKPTEAQFADLIDSLALLSEVSSSSLATLAQALAGLDNTKSMSPFLVKSVLLDWIVNNLTSGGTQKLLSAEQGKILQNITAKRDYSSNPLNAVERTSWRNGLGIIRSGSTLVGTRSTGASITSSLTYANIPSFDPLIHKLFANVFVKPTNQSMGTAVQSNDYSLTIRDYKDWYFKYEAKWIGIGAMANTPVDVYVNWFILEN